MSSKNKEKLITIKLDLSKTSALSFKDGNGTKNCLLELLKDGFLRFTHTDNEGKETLILGNFNNHSRTWDLIDPRKMEDIQIDLEY